MAFLSALTVGTPEAFEAVPGLTPALQAIGTRAYQEASAQAYKTVFLTTLAFSGVGIVVSYWCPNVDKLLVGNVTVTLGDSVTEKIDEKSQP
ncbi:hypothetical protein LTR37_020703 [Vermiconidia calcicola]|uniref:Uncharacterized protein n=1 Tax=Vermiconidia calcicola TaxID=1690605 RepID=A0ACC3MBR6_9PEZI|nr:hypothetical protein LTR37_020703 [Vermiconidia calcicola]